MTKKDFIKRSEEMNLGKTLTDLVIKYSFTELELNMLFRLAVEKKEAKQICSAKEEISRRSQTSS